MLQEQLPLPKVVILGQDPYPGMVYHQGKMIERACGYAFGVSNGLPPPESLANIFMELERDNMVNFKKPTHGYLESWAKQGVISLNTILTVIKDKPNSHAGKGWESFTDGIIKTINENCTNVVFMLWGTSAAKKASFIDQKKHLVLCTSHPSPNSVHRGFYGCNHFSKANEYLKKHGQIPINWNSLNE